jgi:hypothetical protein
MGCYLKAGKIQRQIHKCDVAIKLFAYIKRPDRCFVGAKALLADTQLHGVEITKELEEALLAMRLLEEVAKILASELDVCDVPINNLLAMSDPFEDGPDLASDDEAMCVVAAEPAVLTHAPLAFDPMNPTMRSLNISFEQRLQLVLQMFLADVFGPFLNQSDASDVFLRFVHVAQEKYTEHLQRIEEPPRALEDIMFNLAALDTLLDRQKTAVNFKYILALEQEFKSSSESSKVEQTYKGCDAQRVDPKTCSMYSMFQTNTVEPLLTYSFPQNILQNVEFIKSKHAQ